MKEKNKSQIVLEVENKIEKLIEEEKFRLVDIEIHGNKKVVITIYVYKEGKLDHKDLQNISNKIYPIIESLPYFEDFLLEVSSPGIYRKLKSKKEFEIFKGRNIKLVDGNGNCFYGILVDFKDDIITLKEEKKISNFEIDKIRTAILNG